MPLCNPLDYAKVLRNKVSNTFSSLREDSLFSGILFTLTYLHLNILIDVKKYIYIHTSLSFYDFLISIIKVGAKNLEEKLLHLNKGKNKKNL